MAIVAGIYIVVTLPFTILGIVCTKYVIRGFREEITKK